MYELKKEQTKSSNNKTQKSIQASLLKRNISSLLPLLLLVFTAYNLALLVVVDIQTIVEFVAAAAVDTDQSDKTLKRRREFFEERD